MKALTPLSPYHSGDLLAWASEISLSSDLAYGTKHPLFYIEERLGQFLGVICLLGNMCFVPNLNHIGDIRQITTSLPQLLSKTGDNYTSLVIIKCCYAFSSWVQKSSRTFWSSLGPQRRLSWWYSTMIGQFKIPLLFHLILSPSSPIQKSHSPFLS